MALSPETLKALGDALDAVVQEAGDSPEYAQLVNHLTAASGALPEVSDEPDGDPVPPRDSAEDDYSFETAEARHAEKRAAKKPKSKDDEDKEDPLA